jgi:hypothetical protein
VSSATICAAWPDAAASAARPPSSAATRSSKTATVGLPTARVDVAEGLQVEQARRVLGRIEDVGGGLVDRHARAPVAASGWPGVQAEGLEGAHAGGRAASVPISARGTAPRPGDCHPRRWFNYYAAPEYGGDTVGSDLVGPQYVTAPGWRVKPACPCSSPAARRYGGRAEADSMREVLEREFGVKVRWSETASRDTAENAALSAPLLKANGITRIALVTHASHMPRSAELFRREGIEVLPAPTGFRTSSPSMIEDYLPRNLRPAHEALHEHLGQLFNRIKDALP